jgi:hypothetical protein
MPFNNLYRCTVISKEYVLNTWVHSNSYGQAAMFVLLDHQKKMAKRGQTNPSFKVESYLSSKEEAVEYIDLCKMGHITHKVMS